MDTGRGHTVVSFTGKIEKFSWTRKVYIYISKYLARGVTVLESTYVWGFCLWQIGMMIYSCDPSYRLYRYQNWLFPFIVHFACPVYLSRVNAGLSIMLFVL